jgi:ABC-2 type transport system permease protein
MSLWLHELKLFLRQRVALPALVLLALVATAAVAAGLAEIARQREVIERIQPQQAEDEAAVAEFVTRDGDAGYGAYYTFHATWDEPSALGFAAIGHRDVAPYVLRVRALSLESQIHESENYNAEMALPGRFDWAFVLIYLAPLFLIAILHDLRSSEREAGRMAMLQATVRREPMLWLRRVTWRVGLLYLALCLPFAVGAVVSAGPAGAVLAALGLAALYLLFWTALVLLVGRLRFGSVTNAAALAATWLVLTLVLPGLALLAINAAIPVRQGVELTLAHREIVHAGWDKPNEETMQAFFEHYPEWRDTPPVEGGFHWKWYYAFHHLGDVRVAEQSRAYREGLEQRDRWTRHLGYVLPAVGVQAGLHRLAETDLSAQLAYQDRIRAFHDRLRTFYYPYIFDELPFTMEDFAKAPRWSEPVDAPQQQATARAAPAAGAETS